jgi:aspartate aminotransferase-like enzyme/N-acyl-L-homoserine lactone synthetase
MISSHHVDDRSLRNGSVTIDYDIDPEDIAHLSGVSAADGANPELKLGRYTFKCAHTDEEFEQIHRLNYRTFVEEVGQYPDTGAEALVDKYHDKNRYFIAIDEGRVVGMIATHDRPPFSVTKRLPDPSLIERLGDKVMEVRLLAIEPSERNSQLFRGLLWYMYEFGLTHGYDYLVISGIAGRTRMYERMGFRPLGPAVPDGDASFIPMMVNLRQMPDNILRDANRIRERLVEEVAEREHAIVSLLPGPVQIAPEIRDAIGLRPVSHRGNEFIARYERLRRILSEMSGGLRCAIMAGSGTLANEVVGATIAATTTFRRGLVLNNGEFGRRLAAQASRYGLDFDTLAWEWGERWNFDDIRAALERDRTIDWLWACHCETSTSLMNDIEALFDLAGEFSVRVCLDCVSSFGAVETDISRAHLASAVSGKAIGAITGLAFILTAPDALEHVDRTRIPQYLDLPSAMETVGPRFTIASTALEAFDAAVGLWYDTPEKRRSKYEAHLALGHYVRRRLKSLGFTPLVDGSDAAPIISSFMPPPGITSREFCNLCESWGFEISGLSGYLLERGMVQIATMGDVKRRDCARLFAQLRNWLARRNAAVAACA